MRTCASLPKPVVTPYIVSPRAIAASTTRREPLTAARECAATATEAPWRATETTSSIAREGPSSVTGAGMREEAKCNGGATTSREGRHGEASLEIDTKQPRSQTIPRDA